MNLLPKSRTEFGDTQYWNSFFKQRGNKAFDWYGEYPELCGQLHKYVRAKDEIIMLGCGNSKLSADLYDVGYKQMTNIDISHVVIKQMNKLHRLDRPELIFTQMDATALTYPDQSFSAAIDKGTLDALMPDDAPETIATVEKYWNEVARVLRTGGRYVCVSLLQPHILQKALDYFPTHDFMLRIVRCFDAEEKTKADNPDGYAMPVFLIVATKFTKLPMKILEVNLVGEKILRMASAEEVFSAIDSVQKASLVCSNLNKSNKAALDEEIRIDLMEPGNNETPRYTIVVVDQEYKRKFAGFIVPQGKECEWLFATKEGRQKLLGSAGYGRLAIVLLHRDHVYESLDAIKSELSAHIKQLAPNNMKKDELIPFLSLGEDVGQRTVLHRGNSKFSGDYVVEDVLMDNGDIFRRLIFLNNQFVIQSEALVKFDKKKKDKKIIDLTYLACQHHMFMSFGAVAATKDEENGGNVLVIGLGGGGLCNFIQQVAGTTKVTAVDIDEAILDIAKSYFGLVTTNDKLDVQLADGLEYLKTTEKENRTFNAILFDVDSKDSSLGISCPPKQFIEEETLENVKNCLSENGIFVLNLVCRDDKLKTSIMERLHKMFISTVSYKLEDEVNEIVFCCKSAKVELRGQLKEAMEIVNVCIKKQKLNEGELVDVKDVEKKLKQLML